MNFGNTVISFTEILCSTAPTALFAALWGASEKAADLHNEHNVRWFRGARTLFGVLWGGALGLLLTHRDPLVAELGLAMLLSYLLRGKIDYFNHRLAATISLFALSFRQWNLGYTWLLIFLFAFSLFGAMHDALDNNDFRKRLHQLPLGTLADTFLEYRMHIYLISLACSCFTKDILPGVVGCLHMASYELVRRFEGPVNSARTATLPGKPNS